MLTEAASLCGCGLPLDSSHPAMTWLAEFGSTPRSTAILSPAPATRSTCQREVGLRVNPNCL